MSEDARNCCWMPQMAFLRQRSNLVEPIFVLDEDSETSLSGGNVVEHMVERTEHNPQSPVDTHENSQEKVAEVEASESSSCAICHETNQNMATIDCCSHSFCIACIKEWSERENTCPLCKTRFSTIHHFNENNELVATKVEDKNQQQQNQRVDGSAPVGAVRVRYEIGDGESIIVFPFGEGFPAFLLRISSDGHPTIRYENTGMPEGVSSAASAGSE